MVILALVSVVGAKWLDAHPEHNPWAPLDLHDPVGWATAGKLADLRTDVAACRATLARSNVAFERLPPAGSDECRREDRIVVADASLSPATPASTCIVSAAFKIWMEKTVRPLAEATFGSPVRQVEHLGTFSCRRLYGRNRGEWSQHATGNAIDIAAFILDDGRRISVEENWGDATAESAYLAEIRNGACTSFATVLSPEYNAAHSDHFHLDQQDRELGSVCR